MSNFTYFQQNWNKSTHIFVTSTNSPTTHPVFIHLRGCFSWCHLVYCHVGRPLLVQCTRYATFWAPGYCLEGWRILSCPASQLLSLWHCPVVERKDRGSPWNSTTSTTTPAVCPSRSAGSSPRNLACSGTIDHYNPRKPVQSSPHERTSVRVRHASTRLRGSERLCANVSSALSSALGRARFAVITDHVDSLVG